MRLLSPKHEMINSISNFDVENSLKDIQKRIWTKLKAKPIFNINLKNTHELLEKVVNTNIFLVILYVDLVSSTKLSMNLPLKRLVSNNTSIHSRNVFDYRCIWRICL